MKCLGYAAHIMTRWVTATITSTTPQAMLALEQSCFRGPWL